MIRDAAVTEMYPGLGMGKKWTFTKIAAMNSLQINISHFICQFCHNSGSYFYSYFITPLSEILRYKHTKIWWIKSIIKLMKKSKHKLKKRAWEIAQSVKRLSCKCEDLSSRPRNPSTTSHTHKQERHVCNPRVGLSLTSLLSSRSVRG